MSIVDMDAHPSRYIYKQTAGNLPTDCMEIKRRTQEERSAARYSLGMTEQLITEAIRAGQLARQPVRPLAQVLIGALDEAAMFIATADDPKRARRETRQVLRRLIDGIA